MPVSWVSLRIFVKLLIAANFMLLPCKRPSAQSMVSTTMKTTFLYVFCVVTFPIFNVIFKATRLFQVTTCSSDQFALELDQVKSLFEDSPQLALQLYICFKSKSQFSILKSLILKCNNNLHDEIIRNIFFRKYRPIQGTNISKSS